MTMSTNAMTPRHIWIDAVHVAVIAKLGTALARVGDTGEWLRGERVAAYLSRAYSAGEPVWMAADAVVQMGKGAIRAALEDRDTPESLRSALIFPVISSKRSD